MARRDRHSPRTRASAGDPTIERSDSHETSDTNDAGYTDVGAEGEVVEGSVVARRAAGRDFLLCRTRGDLYAIADRCTHAAWSLAGGELRSGRRGGEIVCSLHGARFDLRTGEPVAPPASKPLLVFAVRVRGGRIEVKLTPPPR